MQTEPCGHRVVCRLCFVKTIQTAVAQRVLPLRCVVCRTKILKLKQSTSASSSVVPARSRGVVQARATRHGGATSGGGIAAALSPRHTAAGGSKLMQPLPIYPALGVDSGGTGGRSGPSTVSSSCHHHHLPLHHQTVQRRAMTAWTASATTSHTATGREGSSSRSAAATGSAVTTSGRQGRRAASSSAAGRVDSPSTATTSRVSVTGHDTRRTQRLK